MAFLTDYWPILLVAAVIGIVAGYYYFKPRQRVTLSGTAPVRPHMAAPSAANSIVEPGPDEHHVLADTIIHTELPVASGAPDDLQRLKGVGPKMALLLNERGIHRFDQIASLSPGQVDAIDASLGAFKGRFVRDRIVEQADYLARGDTEGYAAKFGNL